MKKIDIINLQKKRKINQKIIKSVIKKVFYLLKIPSYYVNFVFCDNEFIRKLNKKYFKRNSSTDVISFPLQDKFNPEFLGEVVISLEEAEINSRIYNTTFQEELNRYIIHGILHLLGYRDNSYEERIKMEDCQESILHNLK